MPQNIDIPWALGRLDWWVTTAEAARRRSSYGEVRPYADIGRVSELREREHQTREVIRTVLERKVPQLLTSMPHNVVEVQTGIDLARYARGVLETREETARHITGTATPAMDADALHPLVWDAAASLWSDGHYSAAVQRSATAVNAEVQLRLKRYDISDGALMAQAFSLAPPDAYKPRLRWPGPDDDLTVKAMRTGLLNFSQGIFAAIRNGVTHSTDELPRQVAFEYLATLSTLARWIEDCELVDV